ncbi:ImmA/IrrE family metallo-endopeptidase [Pseudalkalibacillus sp. NRS-1564]|uniref:ImmA/IrrE family metallo-endopeptidase n=1 Tax=Pseudalkalibacillus sp. NRS-1564 TaxID=3233900 RepID=UPI003D2E906B
MINSIYIEELASTIREELGLNIPTPVEDVPNLLGGKLQFVDEVIKSNESIEAMIKKVENSFEIKIKKNGYEKRDRFSIAHELGHLFLHMGYIIEDELWSSTEEYTDSVYFRYGYGTEEKEADQFAASFLMPKDKFIEKAEENLSGGVFQLRPIADYFNVSLKAVEIRGVSLGLFNREG